MHYKKLYKQESKATFYRLPSANYLQMLVSSHVKPNAPGVKQSCPFYCIYFYQDQQFVHNIYEGDNNICTYYYYNTRKCAESCPLLKFEPLPLKNSLHAPELCDTQALAKHTDGFSIHDAVSDSF